MAWLSLTILGNMAPPSFRVAIAPDQESWHEVAAPIFLVLAVLFACLWLTRFGTVRSGLSRATLLACAGFAGTSYTAWWIWENRSRSIVPRSFESVIAVDMPGALLAFALIFSVVAQWRTLHHFEGVSDDPPNAARRWRVNLLAALMMIFGGLALPFILATKGGLIAFASSLTIALIVWGVILTSMWLYARVRR